MKKLPFESTFSKEIRDVYRDELVGNGKRSIRRLDVVGHNYYGWGVQRDLSGPVLLMPEPDNKYDPAAIAVYTEDPTTKEAVKVGHIKRDETRLLRELRDGDVVMNGTSPLSVYICYET